jgi:hypothetical protein
MAAQFSAGTVSADPIGLGSGRLERGDIGEEGGGR